MEDLDRLAEIAQQLAGRIRDDDPQANARWLHTVLPDPADWFRLCFVACTAMPIDRSWLTLTAWTRPDSAQEIDERRRQLNVALHPKRTAA